MNGAGSWKGKKSVLAYNWMGNVGKEYNKRAMQNSGVKCEAE